MNKLQKNKWYLYTLYLLFALGIFIRVFYFFKNVSFFSDEAMLAENIISGSYFNMFQGLKNLQVAPPFFLVLSKFIIEVLNPNTDYFYDLTLRIIPFVCGIVSMFVFDSLLRLINTKKITRLFALSLFFFNPITILYCAQFKQYSMELLIALLLLKVFYKAVFQNTIRVKYAILIFFAPWLSLSSLFIIFCGFIAIIYKNYKEALKYIIPFLISFVLFYVFYLKNVYMINYHGMCGFWSNAYGFADLRHPIRILIRLGEYYSLNKIAAYFCGICLSILVSLSLFDKKNIEKNIFLISPVMLTYLASFMHHYPIEARLMLFLYPIFCILAVQYKTRTKRFFIAVFCVITIFFGIFEVICMRYDFKAKECVYYLVDNIKDDEQIVFDISKPQYAYYLRKYNFSKTYTIPVECNMNSMEYCNNFLKNLPEGKYYFIAQSLLPEMLTEDIIINKIYSNHSKVIYFEK